MVLAPERPSPTRSRDTASGWKWLAIGLIAVLVFGGFGLMMWLTSRDSNPAVGPGPVGPVGPVGGIGPQDVDSVAGSGVVVTESREVGSFDGVTISGEGTVVIVQADSPSVTVRSDDNLLPLITTEVSGSTLYLGKAPNAPDLDPTDGVRVQIAAPYVSSIGITGAGSISVSDLKADRLVIRLSGAGSIEVSGLDANELSVDGSGAGSITVAGTTNSQVVMVTGAVAYEAAELESAVADIDTNSLATTVVRVRQQLDITLRGLGGVEYYGSPTVTSEITGSGQIQAIEDG